MDYSFFPQEVYRILDFAYVGDYESEIYFFEWKVEDKEYVISDVFYENGGYDIVDIGTYRETYTYHRVWDLKKAIKTQLPINNPSVSRRRGCFYSAILNATYSITTGSSVSPYILT
ncbi:MAG: hypothetical protein ACI4WS_04260 [Oscillospiraceae bacterium]